MRRKGQRQQARTRADVSVDIFDDTDDDALDPYIAEYLLHRRDPRTDYEPAIMTAREFAARHHLVHRTVTRWAWVGKLQRVGVRHWVDTPWSCHLYRRSDLHEAMNTRRAYGTSSRH